MNFKLMTTKALGIVLAAIAMLPADVRLWIQAITLLIAADTATGLVRSMACRQISSHNMRYKLFVKGVQYFGLACLAAAAATVAHTWWILTLMLEGIAGIEVLSIVENMSALQDCGGANLGPILPILRRVAGVIVDAQQLKPPDPPAQKGQP